MISIYLDLSTAHLQRVTMAMLEHLHAEDNISGNLMHLGWPAMSIAQYEHGVFVTVPDNEETLITSKVPEDLKTVLLYACRLRIPLLRFDQDGDFIPGLPEFNW